jgi:hypothetical protein
MPTNETAIRNKMLQSLLDEYLATSTVSTLIVETAANSAIAILEMSSAAFASASGGVSSAAAITQEDSALITATAGQVVAYAPGGSTKMQTFTVGTAGTEFTVGDLAITAGDVVKCTALTFTYPAS